MTTRPPIARRALLSSGSKQRGHIAFGDAAAACLELHIKPLSPRLSALVAYYPTSIPSNGTVYPPDLRVAVHLAGNSLGVTSTSEVLGIQGKRRTRKKKLDCDGGMLKNWTYLCFTYADVEPGFAEEDLPEDFDRVAARLAWSRSLACVTKGFGVERDLEKIWENHLECKKASRIDDMNNETRLPKAFALLRVKKSARDRGLRFRLLQVLLEEIRVPFLGLSRHKAFEYS